MYIKVQLIFNYMYNCYDLYYYEMYLYALYFNG